MCGMFGYRLFDTGSLLDTYRDKSPIKCLRSGSFWMLISINAIGSGAGLTLLNNLGEVVILSSSAKQPKPILFCFSSF